MGSPIDDYLAGVAEPGRSTLETVRRSIAGLLPDATEALAYGAPAFKVNGKAVAGFAAYRHHLSYLPHSGSVLGAVAAELAGYEYSKGALKFALDQPLPEPVIRALLGARLNELGIDRPV